MEDRRDLDHHLVELVLAGDQDAFAQLVRAHQDLVASVAWRYGTPRPEIEDVVSEVFIKVYEGLRRYRPEHAFSTWLYRVAANHVMDQGRRKRREGVRAEVPENLADSGQSARSQLVAEERIQLLHGAIRQLKPIFREIFFLVYVEGQQVDQACEHLGIPAGTGKVRLMRGRQALKTLLLENHPGYFEECVS